MISPTIELPTNEQDTSDIVQYKLIYPTTVEHKFTKVLILPIELRLFNRTKEQLQLHLQILKCVLLLFQLESVLLFFRFFF